MNNQLSRLLSGSRFTDFLKFEPMGVQLHSFIAVANELKPAMDLWVRQDRLQIFEDLAKHLGLIYYIDGFFDRYAENDLGKFSHGSFTTTRAVFRSNSVNHLCEAHIFLARTKENLVQAVGAGWYPLVVDGHIIEKHPADHYRFGSALGYPECCLHAFRKNNDWYCGNSFYTAYKKTISCPNILANGLLRHTAFSYVPHIPCSFSCKLSIQYGTLLRDLIQSELPDYADEIDRKLTSPFLCLSELHIYRFEGNCNGNNVVNYSNVEPVSPTLITDKFYRLLCQGTRCEIDNGVIRIFNGVNQIATYLARNDKHGPEVPFIIQCHRTDSR